MTFGGHDIGFMVTGERKGAVVGNKNSGAGFDAVGMAQLRGVGIVDVHPEFFLAVVAPGHGGQEVTRTYRVVYWVFGLGLTLCGILWL